MISAFFAAALAIGASCDLEHPSGKGACTRAVVDRLPMNAIQVVGSHNSYKAAIAPKEMALIKATSPRSALGLDYSHPSLTQQLNEGARQIELDYVYDPQGGRYAHPLGLKMAHDEAEAPYDSAVMMAPGLKVMHVPDIDYRSVCATFVKCLSEIKAWSKAHPDHLPILIIMNLKDDGLNIPGAVSLLPFDAKAMDSIDKEVLSVFSKSQIITPDEVRGRHPTVRDGVLAGGWPKLKSARGRFLFAVDEDSPKVALYRGARKSLEGRVMFVNTDEASPAAAYLTLNSPLTEGERIAKAVRAGFIVRTRADADTVEARTNDRTRQVAAFASGAQYVSTDYMTPDARLSTYETHLPGGGVARHSPVAVR